MTAEETVYRDVICLKCGRKLYREPAPKKLKNWNRYIVCSECKRR
jgi:DNA-directed RNA polymerase subunit RPC12/RpoP